MNATVRLFVFRIFVYDRLRSSSTFISRNITVEVKYKLSHFPYWTSIEQRNRRSSAHVLPKSSRTPIPSASSLNFAFFKMIFNRKIIWILFHRIFVEFHPYSVTNFRWWISANKDFIKKRKLNLFFNCL